MLKCDNNFTGHNKIVTAGHTQSKVGQLYIRFGLERHFTLLSHSAGCELIPPIWSPSFVYPRFNLIDQHSFMLISIANHTGVREQDLLLSVMNGKGNCMDCTYIQFSFAF